MSNGNLLVTFEGYEKLNAALEKKIKLYKSKKMPYFVYSMLAGIYVGFAMIFIMFIAGLMGGAPGLKIIQGAVFAAALSLVIFAGSELFTGNVLVMTAGLTQRLVTLKVAIGLCLFCWLGNLAGSILIAVVYWGTDFLQNATLEAVQNTVYAKAAAPSFMAIFARGIMCNLLVCLAVWCCYRMNSESGKLIMIFWCIFIFITCGFDHSIANMTLFSMQVLTGADAYTFGAIIKNLIAATLGNTAGEGAAIALCSAEARARLESIRDRCEYIELSASPVFNEQFVEQMMFPESDAQG